MFRHAVPLFRISGIMLRIDASWLLIAALIIWSLSSQYFPAYLPRAGFTTHLLLAIAGMLGLFGSLVLHELAHSIVARRFGLQINGITLFMFGGVAELASEPETPKAEFWIAIAGPLASFAIAGAFWLLQPAAGTASVLFEYLVFVNMALAIFNLIPAYPMDGGRVLRAFLWTRTGSMQRATMIAASTGIVLGLAMIGFGLFSVLRGGGFGALWIILIGFFIFSAARANHSAARYQLTLGGTRVGDLMSPSPVCVSPHVTVSDLVNEVMLSRKISFVPVVDQGQTLGYVDSNAIRSIDRATWAETHVGEVLVPADSQNTLSPDTPAQMALERILTGGPQKFLVLDGARLDGVLSLTDLRAFLSLKEELAG